MKFNLLGHGSWIAMDQARKEVWLDMKNHLVVKACVLAIALVLSGPALPARSGSEGVTAPVQNSGKAVAGEHQFIPIRLSEPVWIIVLSAVVLTCTTLLRVRRSAHSSPMKDQAKRVAVGAGPAEIRIESAAVLTPQSVHQPTNARSYSRTRDRDIVNVS